MNELYIAAVISFTHRLAFGSGYNHSDSTCMKGKSKTQTGVGSRPSKVIPITTSEKVVDPTSNTAIGVNIADNEII